MENSVRLPGLIRYPAALGLALIAEGLLLVIADDIGLLKAIHEDLIRLHLHETALFTSERVALCALLVVPALYAVEWLSRSRLMSVIIGLIAFILVLWFWPH